jgi:hypothetical protein
MAVDVRGTHGESKSTEGITIYDISNKYLFFDFDESNI